MKKLSLPCLLLFIPVLAFAQTPAPVIKNAWKKVTGIVSSFKYNDHLAIMQVTITGTSFELMALDDKLSVVWRDTIKGTAVASGKFRGNILAISDSSYSSSKRNINPYYAFLIDPGTGKIILQNKIFSQPTEYQEEATGFFENDGDNFNMVVRQAEINTNWISAYKNHTEDLTIITLDDKLQPTFVKPKIPGGYFVSMTLNSGGDFFLMTTQDKKSLEVRRYVKGSAEPSEPIVQPCTDLDKTDLIAADNGIAAAETDRNVLYMAITHTNYDHDQEIMVAKFNFTTHQTNFITEVFNHQHVREVEKSFVPAFGFHSVDLGQAKKELKIRYFSIHDGTFIAVADEKYYVTLNNSTTYYEYALVINCYDSELKRLYQQEMPSGYATSRYLTTAFGLGNNELKILTNLDGGAVLGRLDLSTGKWLALDPIITNNAVAEEHVVWFNYDFIAPYMRFRGLSLTNYNVDLSLGSY